MTVKLLNHTPINLVALGAALCTGKDKKIRDIIYGCLPLLDGNDVLSEEDKKLIEKHIIKKGKYDRLDPPHESVLEHLVYTFMIDLSRACLQEMSRHRIASPSVESTRYALKKILKKEKPIEDFVYITGDDDIDKKSFDDIKWLVKMAKQGISNDILKYNVPESFMTRELITINARSLRNFFVLRTHERALLEIQNLARDIYKVLPSEHMFLFEDMIYSKEN